MKFYFSYFKLKFISGLQYKTAAIAGLSTQFFFGFVYIMVYIAFYSSSSNANVMDLSQLISYIWLNQAFYSLVSIFYRDKEIYDLITSGNIAYELTKPKKIYFMWFSKIIGKRLSAVALRSIPVILITFLLPKPYNLSLPASFLSFMLFIITLITGTILMTAITTLYPVITLKTLSEKGIVDIFVAVAVLLSGMVVPIPFFPLFLQKISNFLPFRYVSDLPFRIYSGNIGINEGITCFLIQIFWIVMLIYLGNFLTKKSLKRVVVQGG